MLNSGGFNTGAFNATANTAEDALLAGGVTSAVSVSASYAVSAVLVAAALASSTLVYANQYVAPTLKDGVSTVSNVDAYQDVGAVLIHGIHAGNSVDAGYTYSVTGGLHTASMASAFNRIEAKLQSGTESHGHINPNQYTYTLTGGVHQTSNAYGNVAALVSGGISRTNEVGGYVASLLSGGIGSNVMADTKPLSLSFNAANPHSNNELRGTLYIPITLPFGISNAGELGGDLYWKPGQYGGIDASNTLGGGITADRFMQSDIVGTNKLYANAFISPILSGGLTTNSVIESGKHFNAMLSGGAASQTLLSSNMNTGRTLSPSDISSYSSVGGKYHYPCYLTGGAVIFHELGGEGDVSPMLSGGMVTVCSTDARLVSNADLEGGIDAYTSTDSRLQSSPKLGGTPVVSNSSIAGDYALDAVLHSGVDNASLVGSNGIIANIFLRGGVGASSFTSATMLADSELDDGIAQTLSVVRADIRADAVVAGGASSANMAAAKLKTTGVLSGNFASSQTIDSKIRIHVFIPAGFSSTNSFNAGLKANARLNHGVGVTNTAGGLLRVTPPIIVTGGIHTDYQLSDADISSYYGDMLHNTWQLEIASATELLEISTPIGDS